MHRAWLLTLFVLAAPGVGGADRNAEDAWDSRVCGRAWPEYVRLHRDMLAGVRPGRFLTFKPDPWRGYANQLLGISSAFAAALLTDRALLLRDDVLAAHFSSPFIAWRADRALSSEPEALFDSIKDCDTQDLWTSLAWVDLDEMFPRNVSNVSVSTNVLWTPQLFANPRYQSKMETWGLSGLDSFFSCSMSFLLRPTFRLRRALAPLEQQLRGRYSIGLQLRLNPETAQVRLPRIRYRHDVG